MKPIKAVAFATLALSGFLGVDTATATTVDCVGCTYAEMEQRAFSEASGEGPVPFSEVRYYINRSTGLVGKFVLYREYLNPEFQCVPNPYEVPIGCVTFGMAEPQDVEPVVQNFANYIQAMSVANVPIISDPNMPNDGYELVQYPQMQEAVGAYLQGTQAMFKQEFWNLSTYITGFSAFEVVVNVRISDGSTATYRWDYGTMKFVFVKGSARDKLGNRIPETVIDVAGGGRFNHHL